MKAPSFQNIISPVKEEDFINNYWESSLLHIERDDPDYYDNELFGSIESLFSEVTVNKPSDIDLIIDRDGVINSIPKKEFINPDNTLNVDYLMDRFDNTTCTVKLNEVESYYSPVAGLNRKFENVFNSHIRSSFFISSKNFPGFFYHYDTVEVFVLQLLGDKKWEVYEPEYELPLQDRAGRRESVKISVGKFEHHNANKGLKGKLIKEPHLKQGDMLYFPRGFVHKGVTTNSPSVHLRVGIQVTTWYHLLVNALAYLSDNDVRLRKSLPPGFISSGIASAEEAKELIEAISGKLDISLLKEAMEGISDNYIYTRAGSGKKNKENVKSEDEISPDTQLSVKKDLLSKIVINNGELSLLYPGKILTFPAKIKSELEYIRTSEVFTPEDIPGSLTFQNKLTLTRTLLKEGFITLIGGKN